MDDPKAKKQNLYAVHDSKACAYLAPFTAPTHAVACRHVVRAALTEGHDFNLFPGDYTLFQVGEWDENSGGIQALLSHESIGNVLAMKSAAEEIEV